MRKGYKRKGHAYRRKKEHWEWKKGNKRKGRDTQADSEAAEWWS